MPASAPVTLGRFVIQGEIGRGMMGAVYRAADPDLGRTVALKTVRLAFPVSDSEREQFQQRFLAEARAAGGLSHPNIVIVHEVGRDGDSGTVFIALEYLEGKTVEEVVAEGPMEWRAALRVAARLADALHHAHSRGIIHRDIKPANIMVLPDGEPKIMDFGIAKLPASQLTMAGQFFGTPAYMAPEQAKGDPIDGRADLFSLGGILYLLLTGQRAFAGSSIPAIVASVQTRDPAAPSTLVPGIPESADYIVARALAKDVDKRYPDGRTLAEDLEDAREGREPRHRTGWVPPLSVEATVARPSPDLPSPTMPPLPPGLPEGALKQVPERPALRTAPATASVPPIGGRPAAQRAFVPRAMPGRADRFPPRRVVFGAALLSALLVGGLGLWIALRGHSTATIPAVAKEPARPAEVRRPAPRPAAAQETPVGAPIVEATPAAPRRSSWSLLPTFASPAGLEVSVQHSLKSGRLRVWIDDEILLDERLTGRVRKQILAYKARSGRLERTFEVKPGDRVVRVRIETGKEVLAGQISGAFESGVARRLLIDAGGILRKRVTLVWVAPS